MKTFKIEIEDMGLFKFPRNYFMYVDATSYLDAINLCNKCKGKSKD